MPKVNSLRDVQRVALDLLQAKASQHGSIEANDQRAIRALKARVRVLSAGEDVVRQGDRPDAAVLVTAGMPARYHTLPSGDRQYISFHIAGDLPDIQSLFLTIMDHSLCALNAAEIAILPHDQVRALFLQRPNVAAAFWRLTLIDAAIFRQAIVNNSARPKISRLAHLFCEQYFRAREANLVDGQTCTLPLSQVQLGQALGMAHVSVHRALQRLRKDRLADLRAATLEILNWNELRRLADFDPTYLHLDKETGLSERP